MSYMLKESAGITLAELVPQIEAQSAGPSTECDPSGFRFHQQDGDLVLSYVPANHHPNDARRSDVRLGQKGVEGFANLLGVPTTWAKSLASKGDHHNPDLLSHVYRTLLTRYPATIGIRVAEGTAVQEVFDPTAWRVQPTQLVDIASQVMTPTSEVIEWFLTPGEFQVTTAVPTEFDRGVEKTDLARGDITRGGVRFGMKTTAKDRTPWVQPYAFRLVCTNGMECFDSNLAINGSKDTDEVLLDFEVNTRRAFNRIEDTFATLAELRAERIEGEFTQAVVRIGRENKVPDTVLTHLVNRVPTYVNEGPARDFTMADAVDFVTNAANDQRLENNAAERRRLQRAGGSVVTEHAHRCPNCLSKVD